jgi:hypothetical protein
MSDIRTGAKRAGKGSWPGVLACAPLDWSTAGAMIDGLIEEEGLVAWCGRSP